MALRDDEETRTFHRVTCKKETNAALLCEIDGTDHWIPKSQLSEDSDVTEEGDEGKLVVSEWICSQKGL